MNKLFLRTLRIRAAPTTLQKFEGKYIFWHMENICIMKKRFFWTSCFAKKLQALYDFPSQPQPADQENKQQLNFQEQVLSFNMT